MIIALSGYAKSGKSTVAQMIQSKQPHRRWKIRSFADKLREVASVMTGHPAGLFQDQQFKNKMLSGWGMTAREFLQKLGTEAIRNNLSENAWVNALMAEYNPNENWIIDDCRFPNEALVVSHMGGKVYRINRTNVGPLNDHDSETALDDYRFDIIITNAGNLDFLSKTIDEIGRL